MKPLNLDNKPCSPISSNCVIWQGPDIPCITLCTGDTVSDIVFKLATELCTIMDQLNVSNYDLACFDLASCTPQTFQELLQFLIEQICAAQGITPTDTKVIGCPDCVVSVAPCFVQGTQTTMQLVDYVQLIGNRLCSIIDEIAAINNQITTINATLVDLQYQIDNLPVYTLPEIPVDCILGPGNHALDVIIDALMNDDFLGYCALLAATGTPAEINTAVLSQCIADGDQPLAALPTVTTFSAYYAGSWVAAPALGAAPTVANAINNAWIAICDIYNYLQTAPINVSDSNTVSLTYTGGVLQATVQDTGWEDILGFAYMSSDNARPQCRRIGNEIVFRGVIQVPMGSTSPGDTGTAFAVSAPDGYAAKAYGRTLNSGSSGDSSACLINSAAGSGDINEGISLYFNRGTRVIPTSVLPNTTNFDRDSTVGNKQFVYRKINVSGSNTYLTSIVNVFVSATGQLGITAPCSNENFDGNGLLYASMQRNVVSNIISGENIPLYNPTAPSINNAAAAGSYNANIIGSATTWPFTQNCMSAYQLGGFSIRIDGLRAYVDPCATSIPTPTPCP